MQDFSYNFDGSIVHVGQLVRLIPPKPGYLSFELFDINSSTDGEELDEVFFDREELYGIYLGGEECKKGRYAHLVNFLRTPAFFLIENKVVYGFYDYGERNQYLWRSFEIDHDFIKESILNPVKIDLKMPCP